MRSQFSFSLYPMQLTCLIHFLNHKAQKMKIGHFNGRVIRAYVKSIKHQQKEIKMKQIIW